MALRAAELATSVDDQLQLDRRRHLTAYAVLAGLVALLVVMAYATAPQPFSLAFFLLVAVATATLVNPVIGVYAIVFLSLVGDTVTSTWYPFTKNLSSAESIFYVDDSLVVNPLELVVAATLASWLLRQIGAGRLNFVKGRLLGPLMVFAVFVGTGLVHGLFVRGGDTTVGLWEARPLVYLPILYVLITNLLTSARQHERLFFVAIAGVVAQSLLALWYYLGQRPEDRLELESLTEHAASIHMSALMVFTLALVLLPGCSARRRWWMLAGAVPVTWVWVLSQRRAAAIALAFGVLLLGVVLLWKHRGRALWFLPMVIVVGAAYTLAFWNSTSPAGTAAQAIKSVIAPESLSAADYSSNLYRQIEAFDLWFTIRADEVRGVGFGQPFYQVIPLPDISFFPFWQYMPHNSILWIWLKMGYFGFVAMLFFVARAVQHGARSVLRVASPDQTAVVFGALAYVVMYMIYAYVDIAWDIRSMVFLAVALAICADFEQVAHEDHSVSPQSADTSSPHLVSA